MSKSTMNHFSPFGTGTWRLLGFLAMGLEGVGVFTIRASRNGLKLSMGGTVCARGKDADALCADFDRWMEGRRAVLESMKSELERVKAKAAKT